MLKGNSHIFHSVKVIKVNGSILSLNISQTSRHFAIGSDKGYVSLGLPSIPSSLMCWNIMLDRTNL